MRLHADICLSNSIIKAFFILALVEMTMLGYQRWFKSQLIESTGSATPSSTVHLLHFEPTDPLEEFKQHNNDLIQSVNRYCQTHRVSIFKSYANKRPSQAIMDWVWTAFPALDLFYCAIPKCASTTWKSYLVEATGCPECKATRKRPPGNIHQTIVSKKTLRAIFNLRDKVVKSKLDPVSWISNSNYTNKMMIVRNPWHRLVSAYSNKIVGEKWSLKRFCPRYKIYNVHAGVATFKQFLDCVLQRRSGQLANAHTHPMADLCGVCHINYSLIVKLEEIHYSAQFIQEILNIEPNSTHYNPANNVLTNAPQTSVNKHIAEYYRQIDNTTIRRLKEEYKYDFQLFGYPDSPYN